MENDENNIQVDIFGLSLTSTLSGGGYAILLKEVTGERRLPIIIGQFEAQAIALELEGMKPPRPLTHDLLKNVIENLGFNVESVLINELKDSTFFAKIRFDIPTIDEIDARPSDAIALALKFSAPIFVAANIMDEIGFIPEEESKNKELDFFDKTNTSNDSIDELSENIEEKLKKLRSELDVAVNTEDYEKAAFLRDEIKKLEISNLN